MITSQPHLKAKLLTLIGVDVCKGDYKALRSLCVKELKRDNVYVIETLEDDDRKENVEPIEEIEEVQIGTYRGKTTKVGTSL